MSGEQTELDFEREPIGPSADRAERLRKFGGVRNPALAKVSNEKRIGFAEMQRREAMA